MTWKDIAQIGYGKNPSGTLDAAMIFIHELKHAQGLQDPTPFIRAKVPSAMGETVEHMNTIRKELGLSTRSQYLSLVDDRGRHYIPFSEGPIFIPGAAND